MGGGGKGASGESTSEIRFAPYIEAHHQGFLNYVQDAVVDTQDDSPYDSHVELDIEDAFFGCGYVLSSFPSLYDMYGKFMAGLDVETLFSQIYEESTDNEIISNLISAQATELSDDLEDEAFPRFETGLRDINSVIASTFIVGKAIMESKRVQELSRFGAELRYRMIPVAADRWKTHLSWNRGVIEMYAQIIKFYISAEMDVQNFNYEISAKDKLWPFTVLEYYRAAVGALTGARNEMTDVGGASTAQKAIGGALAGAAAGGMIAGTEAGAFLGPWGIAGGAALGLASGLL